MTTSPRRSGARTRTAALLTSLALAAGVSACSGDGGDDTATEPDPASDSTSSTPSPSEDPPSATPTEGTDHGTAEAIDVVGSAGVTRATMVHATDAGGSSSTLAFALDTDQAVDDFVAEFDDHFAMSIGAAVGAEAALAPDATPYGATVAVGCDAPRSVAIDAGEAGFEVVPQLPKNTVQCFAPMTYVVVFTAPDA